MVYTKDNKEIKNHSRKNLHKIRHKKTKVKKNKSRKNKSNKTRKDKFARGKRYCDYEIGDCWYTPNRHFGRYKAHKTSCPTRGDEICTHVTVMDKWYPNLGHWHFGKKEIDFVIVQDIQNLME